MVRQHGAGGGSAGNFSVSHQVRGKLSLSCLAWLETQDLI
jgi:hypothetical protein